MDDSRLLPDKHLQPSARAVEVKKQKRNVTWVADQAQVRIVKELKRNVT